MVPANSPYLTIINHEIYRLLQMGFIQKWLTEYLPKKDRCSNNGRMNEIENHTVNLTDMQGCFLVLIAGECQLVEYVILNVISSYYVPNIVVYGSCPMQLRWSSLFNAAAKNTYFKLQELLLQSSLCYLNAAATRRKF